MIFGKIIKIEIFCYCYSSTSIMKKIIPLLLTLLFALPVHAIDIKITSPTKLRGFHIEPSGELILATEKYLARSTDGGQSWDLVQELAGSGDVKFVKRKTDILLMPESANQQVWRSVNKGISWETFGISTAPSSGMSAALIDQEGVAYACGGTSEFKGLYVSEDAGITWRFSLDRPKMNLTGEADGCQSRIIGSGIIYIAGQTALFKSLNKGISWESAELAEDENPKRAHLQIDHDGTHYKLREHNLYVSRDQGHSWTKQSLGSVDGFIVDLFITDRNITVVGVNIDLENLKNDQTNFYSVSEGKIKHVFYDRSSRADDQGNLYSLKFDSELMKSSDHGKTWQRLPDVTSVLRNVPEKSASLAAGNVNDKSRQPLHVFHSMRVEPDGDIVLAMDHHIVRSNNAGKIWNITYTVPGDKKNYQFLLPRTHDLLAVGDEVMVSANKGLSWSKLAQKNSPTMARYFRLRTDISLDSSGRSFYCTIEGVNKSNDGGVNYSDETWHKVVAYQRSNACHAAASLPDYIYAISTYGLYKYTETIGQWNIVDQKQADTPIKDNLVDIPRILKLTDDGKLYLLKRGNIYVSTDGGESWTINNFAISNGTITDLGVIDERMLVVGIREFSTADKPLGDYYFYRIEDGKLASRINIDPTYSPSLAKTIQVDKAGNYYILTHRGPQWSKDQGRTWKELPVSDIKS